jgi:hypothetical protein
MSLSERLATPPKPIYGCKLRDWVLTLSEEDQETVWRCLKDPSYSIDRLVTEFAAEGCPVKHQRLTVHRQGKCSTCEPE